MEGIDVSNHQAIVDWPAVAREGWRFAIIKASEGVDFRDAYFARNWDGAKVAGLVRGAYHFARPSENRPMAEADFFLSIAGGRLESGDLLALDMEDDRIAAGADLADWSLAWLSYVERRVGFKPLFYSYPDYMRTRGLTNRPDLAAYPLWYASYRPDMPPPPAGWPGIAIWQRSGDAQAGPFAKVDLNVFTGSREGLMALGKPAAGDPADAAFDAYAALHPELGAKRSPGAGVIKRAWAGTKVMGHERGYLAYVDGLVVDITARMLDDAETYMERDGSLTRYT